MPSAFSHAVVAAALGTAFVGPRWPVRVWALGAACAVLPDVDVFGGAIGIPFWSPFGHRGLTHSLMFAAALAAVVALGCRWPRAGVSRGRLWLYLFLATTSHGVLDAMTNGGPGIAFFAPLTDTRYFFPFRPILVSPIGIPAFFSEWGLRVLQNEALWIGLPSLIFAGAVTMLRRRAR